MPSWTFAELGRHSALCRAVGPVLALGHTFGKDIRGQWARPLHAPYLVRTLARSPACSQPIRKYGSSSPIVPFTPISDCSASCGPMHATLPPQQDCAWSRLTQSGVQSCCIWAGTAHLKLHTNDMAAYHRRLPASAPTAVGAACGAAAAAAAAPPAAVPAATPAAAAAAPAAADFPQQ